MRENSGKFKNRRKKNEAFDENVEIEQAGEARVPSSEMKKLNQTNVMLSMLKGVILTYSAVVDSSYELMLCSLEDKADLDPLLELDHSFDNNFNERLVSKVIQNVEDLISNVDVPLDYLEPEEIESSYSSISKDTNHVEVKIL